MAKEEKSKYQKLEERLVREKKNSWNTFPAKELTQMEKIIKDYMAFISAHKSERLFVTAAIGWAEENGFVPFDKKRSLKAGDKVYIDNRGKNLLLAHIGSKGVAEGFNILASHVDSPRLDLKPSPLFEDGDSQTALLKTHYYGGIKKYQWVQLPLALVGVVALKDGSSVEVSIGDAPGDPCFMIPDLLPHLAHKIQNDLKLPEIIKGEQLNLLVGSRPVNDEKVKQAIKLSVLEKLNEEYGIVEEDFLSAELEAVPAGEARELGLDRSMVAAYGHDDRVCAWTNLWGLFELNKNPQKTAIVFLADKEETGSNGSTGMDSSFFYHSIARIVDKAEKNVTDLRVRDLLSISAALSTDVSAGVNPNFKGVHEMNNAPKLGFGCNMLKYTGVRGKGGSNDADAEYIARLRKIFDDGGVPWQLTELGKVDEGGGGTVAYLLARHLIHTIDLGVPLLGMHSPWEIASKVDIYSTAKAGKVFFEKM